MSFDWSDYLSVAKELANIAATANKEAKLRSAVSRAYYAAFIKARNHLRDREGLLIPRTSDAHSYVSQQFKSSPNAVRQSLAEKLVRLRRFRRTSRLCRYLPRINWYYTNSFKIITGSNFNFEQSVNSLFLSTFKYPF